VAEWLVLRCNPFDRPLRLSLSFIASLPETECVIVQILTIDDRHSFMRKFFLHIELFYRKSLVLLPTNANGTAETVNIVFSWFALGNYFIAFDVLTVSHDHVRARRTISLILSADFNGNDIPFMAFRQYSVEVHLPSPPPAMFLVSSGKSSCWVS